MTKNKTRELEEELRQYGLIITALHAEIWRLRDAIQSLSVADKYHADAQILIRDARDGKAGRDWLDGYRQAKDEKREAVS